MIGVRRYSFEDTARLQLQALCQSRQESLTASYRDSREGRSKSLARKRMLQDCSFTWMQNNLYYGTLFSRVSRSRSDLLIREGQHCVDVYI